jgi:hypothetical protein
VRCRDTTATSSPNNQFFGGRATRPWELLNLKIAKALGLTIRQSVLSQVDEVIQ